MRPEMMCKPPAKRSTEASSAARTLVFDTSTRASSSFTSAVSATSRPLVHSWCAAGSFTAAIAMLHADGHARERAQSVGQLADDGHRAVLAAGASDRDGRMSLVLTLVAREHRLERGGVGVDELACTGLAEYELGHLGVLAVEVPELGDPEGVGQESRVGHQVGVGREPV